MNRYRLRWAERHRVVFSSPPVVVWLDEPLPQGGAGPRARLVRVVRRRAFSPLGATVARPVGDTLATAQILRLQ